MSASYPGSGPKTFTSKATNDTIQAAHVNDLQDEVTAVETALLGTLLHDVKLTTAKKFYEQGRTKALGETITPAYSAGNFTAAGGGTWTVGSGDINAYSYRVIGDTMFLGVDVINTSVAGTVTSLIIAVPGGFTIAETKRSVIRVFDNSSIADAFAGVVTAQTNVVVTLNVGNFAVSTDATTIVFELFFKVA